MICKYNIYYFCASFYFMFYLLLFTVLSFYNPSGKLLDYWGWNQHITKTEWVSSISDKKSTFQLSAKKFQKLSFPLTNYFFDPNQIPFIEKILQNQSKLQILNQFHQFINYKISFLFFHIIDVLYPSEDS